MSKLSQYLKAKRGRMAKLARDLDVTAGAIYQWAHTQVPAQRMHAVSRRTGIPLDELRPDLFRPQRKAS